LIQLVLPFHFKFTEMRPRVLALILYIGPFCFVLYLHTYPEFAAYRPFFRILFPNANICIYMQIYENSSIHISLSLSLSLYIYIYMLYTHTQKIKVCMLHIKKINYIQYCSSSRVRSPRREHLEDTGLRCSEQSSDSRVVLLRLVLFHSVSVKNKCDYDLK
jgi:hypothetical protein